MISPATPAAGLPEKLPLGRPRQGEGGGRWLNIPRAGAMILCLAFLAVGILVLALGDRSNAGLGVSCFLLPAAIYILGWFYYLPESLGGTTRSPRSLAERWTLWLRASGLLGLACLLGWGVLAVQHPDSALLVALVFGVFTAYLVAVVMVLLRRHFAPEDGQPGSTLGSARQRWVRVFETIGAPARHLANWLRLRVSLCSGSMLVLASVLLVTSMDVGCHNTTSRGYEVLQGKGAWLTAENMGKGVQKAVATVAGYANYGLGLVAALTIAIILVVRLRRADSVRPRVARWLVFATGVAALFTISDLAFYMFSDFSRLVYCILMLVYWAAPMAAWLYYGVAGGRRERWPMIRSSLIILYLPVLLWSYGFLMLVAGFGVYGYLSYFFGIQLAWWGSIQLLRANSGPSSPPAQPGAGLGMAEGELHQARATPQATE